MRKLYFLWKSCLFSYIVIPMEKRFCWLSPKLEVRETAHCGKGNFAVRDIDKGELLMIHGGWILTRAEETALPEPYNDYGLPITEDLVLYSREDDTFINHSCDPNAGYKGQIFLVAMRDIERGRGDMHRLRDDIARLRRREAVQAKVLLRLGKLPGRDYRRRLEAPGASEEIRRLFPAFPSGEAGRHEGDEII